MTRLQRLTVHCDADYTFVSCGRMSADITKLSSLESLTLHGSFVVSLPDNFSNLRQLSILKLNNADWNEVGSVEVPDGLFAAMPALRDADTISILLG